MTRCRQGSYTCVTVGGGGLRQETHFYVFNTLYSHEIPSPDDSRQTMSLHDLSMEVFMYIDNSYNIINLQVINIINFPLCITSSRTYSFNPGLYPATIRSRATPGLSE